MWQGKWYIMYGEFLGHYFVSGLRSLKTKKPKKPKNHKKTSSEKLFSSPV